MLERLHQQAARLQARTDDVAERQAFVELLVAAIYVDHKVTQEELEAIDSFDESHPAWDVDGFNVGQYFPAAAAKVRRAREDNLMSMLVIEITARFHDDRVRDEAVAACAELLASDGMTDEERAFLDIVTSALG